MVFLGQTGDTGRMVMTWLDLIIATLAATVGAGILLLILWRLDARPKATTLSSSNAATGPVFLFRDRLLIDATPDAQAMIAPHTDQLDELDAALHVLSSHFPTLREILDDEGITQTRIKGRDADGLWIDVDRAGGRLRLAVKGQTGATASDVIERDVRLSELAMLRDMTQHSPQLIWQEDCSGRLIWANHTYLTFCDKVHSTAPGDTSAWPDVSLFPDLHSKLATRESVVSRVSITLPARQAEQWFDVTSVKRGEGSMHFATDANAVVRADHERRHFVQTLSKTFADLSIGLAIFNKRRELSMFNPALLDLTNLPVEFLSCRPRLEAVLDRLRETRMLPEPRNYTSWRDHFTAVEAAAKDGRYTEIWNLPEGQTYRVTGRPHPDGAFAFLFEDISAEMSLTRRFRSDIETGQAVLDTLPEAIVVFSSAGTLVMSNTAYANLWGDLSDEVVAPHELQVAARIWQSRSAATPVWAELQNFIQVLGPRKPWSDRVILDDGRQLRCTANPISGGMTMVKFSFAAPMKPVIRKLTMPDTALMAAKR